MAPPFSARRPIPGIQPFFETAGDDPAMTFSSHYPHPRLVQLRAACPPLRGSCEFFGFSRLPFARNSVGLAPWHGWKALFPQPPVLETGALRLSYTRICALPA